MTPPSGVCVGMICKPLSLGGFSHHCSQGMLPVGVILLIIILVVAAPNPVQPIRIATVPGYCGFKPLFQLNPWPPSQFCFNLAAVQRIAAIVARTICNISDQRFWFVYRTQNAAHHGKVLLWAL